MKPVKLIVALDYDNRNDALSLVDKLCPTQCAVKVGSELFTLFGPELVRDLMQRQFRVFLDLKFHDIPHTVARACKALADLGVWMLTVHAVGGRDMLLAAKKSFEGYDSPPLLIAVTVLTSMGQAELTSTGVHGKLQHQVLQLAQMARHVGLDGVVCSAFEAPMIKQACGQSFLAVTPGIRLKNESLDDQSRVMTPELALRAGSDYLVVGRSITRAKNPKQVIDGLLSIFCLERFLNFSISSSIFNLFFL